MMGQQPRNESLFYYFRLEDQIPENHLLRLIDRYVDLSFVRERLKGFYSPMGRPSIDPEVLLRLLVVGSGLAGTGCSPMKSLYLFDSFLRRWSSFWRRVCTSSRGGQALAVNKHVGRK